MEKTTSCKKSVAVTAETPPTVEGSTQKSDKGNEQAKMGNGWRVLGAGQVHTQNH